MSAYESLFDTSERRSPRFSVDREILGTGVPLEAAAYLQVHRLPAELEEYTERRNTAITARDAAIEDRGAIRIGDTTTENLFTMWRAVEHYGQEVIKEQGIDKTKLDAARLQLTETTTNGFVDGPSFIITALSLARMRHTDKDSIERKAAVLALDSLEKSPDELDKIQQRNELGPHTGELAVQAIMEQESQLLSA